MPRIISLERNPAKRQKRVYIDILQNNQTKMVACAYSVRARPQAPVSTPLLWKEVKHGLDPTDFTIKTVPKRLKKGDLFKEVLGKGIDLKAALKKLDEIV
jgi:bifunctional non-homologous end joining protein LigD